MVNTETYKFQDMKSEFLADPVNQAIFDALTHEYALPSLKLNDCHENYDLKPLLLNLKNHT